MNVFAIRIDGWMLKSARDDNCGRLLLSWVGQHDDALVAIEFDGGPQGRGHRPGAGARCPGPAVGAAAVGRCAVPVPGGAGLQLPQRAGARLTRRARHRVERVRG